MIYVIIPDFFILTKKCLILLHNVQKKAFCDVGFPYKIL